MKIINIIILVAYLGCSVSLRAEERESSETTSETTSSKSIPSEAVSLDKPVEDEPIDQYYKDNHGLGFGLGGGAAMGLHIYYDANLHDQMRSQIHVRFFSATDSRTNLFGTEIVALNQTNFGVVYRKLFRNGFYVGSGLSSVTSSVKYTNPTPENEENKYNTQEFNFSATAADFDIGWQGNDSYYFSVGINISAPLSKAETYSTGQGEEKVTETNRFANIQNEYQHRAQVKEFYDKGKDPSFFYLGFGWYLED